MNYEKYQKMKTWSQFVTFSLLTLDSAKNGGYTLLVELESEGCYL